MGPQFFKFRAQSLAAGPCLRIGRCGGAEGGEIFFESRFSNYNFGQYSPKRLISVDSAREAISVMGESSFDPTYEYVSLRGDLANFEFKGTSTGRISYDRNAVIFNGEADEETMHVLPILFSNCLESSAGNNLIRVNLLLTGIIFSGDTRDQISFEGALNNLF